MMVVILLSQAEAMHDMMECSECHTRENLDYMLCLRCHDRSLDTSGLKVPYSINSDVDLAAGSFDYFNYTGHQTYQCLNCHDSHDNNNYRNIKEDINGQYITVNGIGDPLYQNNVYISGMSDFCIVCHQETTAHAHPVDVQILGSYKADYDIWMGTAIRLSIVEIPSGNVDNIADARVFCMTCHVAHGGPFKNLMRWEGKEGCLECHAKN